MLRLRLTTIWADRGPTILCAPYVILRGLGYAAATLSIAYLAVSLYALIIGSALPTAAAIRWWPFANWLARNEPYLGCVLLACAGLGAISLWLAPLHPAAATRLEHAEQAALRFFRRWGFVIATCWLVFSISALWAVVARPGDLQSSSIGGLIGYADAGAYVASAHDQAKEGVWNPISQRRPLAAAFRSVLMFFGAYSIALMLLLQACLLSAVTCFAAWAVTKWRGIWPGVTFFALVYTYVRTFAPTALTEPQGLFWALFSVPFFIEALRTRALSHGLVAFAATSVALMTRMGSLFTVPALILWMILFFGRTAKQKAAIAAICVAILAGVWSMNFLLERAYGTGRASTGSNFSYTICGLSMGTAWDGCRAKLVRESVELPATEPAFAKLMYAMAWDNFKKNPDVMARRLQSGFNGFARNMPSLLWRGYFSIPEPRWFPRRLLFTMCLIASLYALIRSRDQNQIAFWLLLWTSLFTSAAFVYFDDGMRVLAASIPLMSLFFAMGLSRPAVASNIDIKPDAKLLRCGAVVFGTAAVLYLSAPWLAHQVFPTDHPGAGATVRANEALIFGGRRLAGFLVVEDGKPLRDDLPMVHLSDFSRIIEESGAQNDQGLVRPQVPPLPFGFIFAPRLEKNGESDRLFIVPAAIIERREVAAWRLRYEQWQRKPSVSPTWFYVTHADPL